MKKVILALMAVFLPFAAPFGQNPPNLLYSLRSSHRLLRYDCWTVRRASVRGGIGGMRSLNAGMGEVMTRAEVMKQLAVPLAGFAAFRAGAAIAVVGQPRMPPLTGTYDRVGVRVVRVNAGGGSVRAKVFYPALDAEGIADADYCTDGRVTSDGMAGLVGFRQLGISFLLAHLASAKSGALLDAPPVRDARFPLLVRWSRGSWGGCGGGFCESRSLLLNDIHYW